MRRKGKPTKQQRKKERAERGAQAPEAFGDGDADGICKCGVKLDAEALRGHLSRGAGEALQHQQCAGCDRPSSKKAGKKQKAARPSRDDEDAAADEQSVLACLTCGFAGCEASHAYAHFIERNQSRGKSFATHSIFMRATRESADFGEHRAKCFECSLPVAARSIPLDDDRLFNSVDTDGALLDFSGYLIDEHGDVCREFTRSCELITQCIHSGADALGPVPPAPRHRGRHGGKLSKQAAGATRKAFRADKRRARSQKARGVAAAAARAGLAGLQNLGNTCYFSSSVQAVAATPGLLRRMEALEKDRALGRLTTAACALVLKMRSGTAGGSVSAQLKALLNSVHAIGPQFSGYGQHDAQEFLRFLTDTVEMEFHGLAKQEAGGADPSAAELLCNPFRATFGGTLVSRIRCSTCSEVSCRTETFYDVSVSLHGRRLAACLDEFFREEPLEDCKYPCPHCNKVQFEAQNLKDAEERSRAIERLKEKQEANGMQLSMSLKDALDAYESDRNSASDEEETEESDEADTDASCEKTPSNPPHSTAAAAPSLAGQPPNHAARNSPPPVPSTGQNLATRTEAKPDRTAAPPAAQGPKPDTPEAEGRPPGREDGAAADLALFEPPAADAPNPASEPTPGAPGGSAPRHVDPASSEERGGASKAAAAEDKAGGRAKSPKHAPPGGKRAARVKSPSSGPDPQPAQQPAGKAKQATPNKPAKTAPEADKLYTKASKKYAIREPPHTVAVHLKRFKFCPRTIAFVKDETRVEIPEWLSMAPYLEEGVTIEADPPAADTPTGRALEVPDEHKEALADLFAMFPEADGVPETFRQCDHDSDRTINELLRMEVTATRAASKPAGPPGSYKLYAVVEHQGQVGFGHYIAYVLRDGRWYCCNDECVSESNFEAATRCPYLLFYSRD
ncbi:Ubiquitin carboxyl-terminal hydrolase 9 [Diplonema papillatum]|nr:Ubiquitin carboxyl-terminal hydrolase 9 [Diplonema papillatum]